MNGVTYFLSNNVYIACQQLQAGALVIIMLQLDVCMYELVIICLSVCTLAWFLWSETAAYTPTALYCHAYHSDQGSPVFKINAHLKLFMRSTSESSEFT